jgi:hypothetical protein
MCLPPYVVVSNVPALIFVTDWLPANTFAMYVSTDAKLVLLPRLAFAATVIRLASIFPLSKLVGTAVIGITIFAVPLKLCAVAVTPDKPIVLAVCNFVALPAFPVVGMLAVPVRSVAGTAVIGITIAAVPSKFFAVAVTPERPMLRAVASFVALAAVPVFLT